ncbi:hypothetical protein OTU49_015951, partial [Cherax quadricarinatus]
MATGSPTCGTMNMEVGTPVGTPAGTPTQPQTHHFHSTPDHASTALHAMNKLRINTQLCDIELVAGAVSVFAHRVVLAAASAYFHVMFNSDLVEKTQERVALQELDST